VTCQHLSAAITDHAVQGLDGTAVRYAWRGACTSCRHGVVGVTSLPADLSAERLNVLLTQELSSYLSKVATSGV
jgi:hypothetical protein